MKTIKYLLLSPFVVLLSWNQNSLGRDQWAGDSFSVKNQEAQVFFDRCFDAFAVRHSIPDTIDSCRTYLHEQYSGKYRFRDRRTGTVYGFWWGATYEKAVNG